MGAPSRNAEDAHNLALDGLVCGYSKGIGIDLNVAGLH